MSDRYTVQLFVAGYATPDGRDVLYARSLADVADVLLDAHERAERFGAGYEPTSALVWRGAHEDVTDLCPDRSAVIGPRGGVRWE